MVNFRIMKENILKDKAFAFAIRIVRSYQFLKEKQREYVMSKQLLRSGTAIGALVREAEHAEGKADFIHKNAIAQKEANETLYWLELLAQTDYLSKEVFLSIHNDATELLKILTASLKTAKANH